MDPKEQNIEQDFKMILDNFISNDEPTQEENTQVEYSCWDDEWDNCNGDIILFI